MNKLQALVTKKRQAARDAGGERKWAKRVEREELERFGKKVGASQLSVLCCWHWFTCLVDSHVSTLQAVDEKPPQASQEADVADAEADVEAVPDLHPQESVLADSEVRRRLRRLGHPVTLFAEENAARYARLRHIERTVEVHDDEAGGGERANVLHTIAKEDRLKAQAAANQSSSQRTTDVPTPPNTSANAEDEVQVWICLRISLMH